jgi:hypothetical protein
VVDIPHEHVDAVVMAIVVVAFFYSHVVVVEDFIRVAVIREVSLMEQLRF